MAKKKKGKKLKILSVPCPDGLLECIELYRVDRGFTSTAKAIRRIVGDALVEEGFAEVVTNDSDGHRPAGK